MVLQGSKDPGLQCVMLTMSHQGAPVWPCEWPSEDFMDRAGIKEEFNAYLRNADLVSFEAEKCRQYHYLTSSFVRRQKGDIL